MFSFGGKRFEGSWLPACCMSASSRWHFCTALSSCEFETASLFCKQISVDYTRHLLLQDILLQRAAGPAEVPS